MMTPTAPAEAFTAVGQRPLQNRVTPWGEIVAIEQRGLFTGNRGIIHDPASRTLLRRRWASKAWLICSCSYKGYRRDVMARRSWTELFFYDEAVAFAAGHRPCFLCRRSRAEAFRAAWAEGRGCAPPTAVALDAVLHGERMARGRKLLHMRGPARDLPPGTMIQMRGSAWTTIDGWAWRWTEAGYAAPERADGYEGVLTPPSTVQAFVAGYRPELHPTLIAAHAKGGRP
jgi:hypothetical protein